MDANNKNNSTIEPEKDKLSSGFERLIKLDKKRSNMAKISIKEFLLNLLFPAEHKLSFDEYLNMLSESIDKKIIETQKEDVQKVFVGGHIFFRISDDKKFLLFNAENYYKKGEEWFKNQSSGKTALSKFDNDSLQVIKDKWEKQKKGEEWKYDIDPPDMNKCK